MDAIGGPPISDTPAYWRGKAADARRIARGLPPDAQEHMIAAANSYERLARLIEKVQPVTMQPMPANTP
jgi:hypothetical protein